MPLGFRHCFGLRLAIRLGHWLGLILVVEFDFRLEHCLASVLALGLGFGLCFWLEFSLVFLICLLWLMYLFDFTHFDVESELRLRLSLGLL